MIWLTLVLSAIAGYLVFWAGVVSLIGFGGWRQLANLYPAEEWPEDEGIALSWQTGSVGVSNYGNVLQAVIGADGLYLRPARMFAFNHPPVLVPWGAVVGISRGFLGGIKLKLEGGKSLALRGKVARYVEEAVAAYGETDSAPEENLLDEPDDEMLPEERSRELRQRSRT